MQYLRLKEGTPESDELALLLVLVKDYEDKYIQIPEVDPIDVIKLKMAERGMKAKDLESIIGSKGHVSSIFSGRREITLKMAPTVKGLFQTPGRNIFSCRKLIKNQLKFKPTTCHSAITQVMRYAIVA